jgi:hypothetical protein
LCAAQLKVWIQDPNNWIERYNEKTTNFLDLQNAKNYDFTEDLSGCSPLYVSNPDGKLTVYAQNWVCPLSSASVFGSATSRYKPTSSAHVIMALIFAFTLLLR